MSKILTIDFGGMSVKYMLLERGISLYESSTPSKEILSSHELAAKDVVNVFKYLKKEFGGINGIAMSFNSPVKKESFVNWSHIVANPEYKDMKQILIKEGIPKNCPITIVNDGKAAVYAEFKNGNGKGYKDIVLLTFGTAIGGGIILNENLISGKFGMAGELSCVLMKYDYKDYSNILTWHEYASMTAFEKIYKENSGTLITGKEIFKKYDANEKNAILAVDELIRRIAFIVYNCFYMYGQEITIIGGGLSNREDIPEKIQKQVNLIGKRTGMDIPEKIVLAKYKNKAGNYGAYYHHLESEKNG